MTEKTTALVDKKQETLPASFTEVSNMAKAFVQSGYFSDTKQLAQAIVKIQAGKELGLPPVYSMQNINLIRDRLTSSANTMAMLVKKSGRYNYRVKEHTDQSCVISFYEREVFVEGDRLVEVGESQFTMEDAKRANLVKPDSGWVKYPRAMLFSRAISQGARMYAPDAIGGIYTDEEIRSIPPRPEDAETAKVDTTAGEIIEQPVEPEPSPDVTGDTASPFEEESRGKLQGEEEEEDKETDWYTKSLKKIKWTEKTVTSYLGNKYQVDKSGDIFDVIGRLNSTQEAEFVQEIKDRLEMI